MTKIIGPDIMERAERGIRAPRPALTTTFLLAKERLMAVEQSTTSFVSYKDILDFPGYRAGDDGSVWSAWRRGAFGKCHIDRGRWFRMRPTPTTAGRLMV